MTFKLVNEQGRYELWEARVNGNLIAVILMTVDKDEERWFETRVVVRGYEENEVWEAFLARNPHFAATSTASCG